MKRILFTLFIFVFAQNIFGQGINFQGVARSANGTILASSNISLRLSIISKSVDATPEYVEIKKVVTNAQGIFSIVIGDAVVGSTTGTFSSINWANAPKFLKVEMDPSGGTSYINMGITQLQYVPYSFYSLGVAAENVTGVLPVEKGGTGVGSLADLKTALKISNFDSTALSSRIDTKLSKADTASLSNRINATAIGQFIKTDSGKFTSGIFIGRGEDFNLANNNNPSNLIIGIGAGTQLVSKPNTSISGYNNDNNTIIGNYAGSSLRASEYANGGMAATLNVLVGNYVGQQMGSKSVGNTIIGWEAARFSSASDYGGKLEGNVSIGGRTLQYAKKANANVVVGDNTFNSSTNVNSNVAIGNNLGYSFLTGDNNVLIGSGVLDSVSSGNKNIIIGSNAISKLKGDANVLIGYNVADSAINTISNKLYISNSNTTSPLIYGEFDNSKLTVNGSLSANSFKVPGGLSTQYLRADGTVTTSVTAGVPYTGANQSVDLGAYDLMVNGLTIGIGGGTTTNTTNTAVGNGTLANNTSGFSNTAMGLNSMKSNTVGFSNVAYGIYSMYSNTTGIFNTAIGDSSLYSNTTGYANVGVGYQSLALNTTSIANVAVGNYALKNNQTGSYNTALGGNALNLNQTGASNIAIGNASLFSNLSGNTNVAVGAFVLNQNTTGYSNVALGASSLKNNQTGSNNVTLGDSTLFKSTLINGTTAIGSKALYNNTSGTSNTALGYQSLTSNTIGSNNTAIGYSAMSSSSTYSNSTALGYNAQVTANNQIQLGDANITEVKTSGKFTAGSVTYPNTAGTNGYYLKTDGSGTASWATVSGSGIPYTGATQAVDLGSYDLTVNGLKIGKGLNNISGNTVLGNNSLSAIGISGGSNTAIGSYNLSSNLTGQVNVSVGTYSLYKNISGSSNVSIGDYALFNNLNASRNVAIGTEALTNNISGDYNTSVGLNSMYYNTIGGSNSALGVSALSSNVNGAYNTAVGVSALASNVSGSNNTAIGNLAMFNNTTYSNSTALGYNAQVTASNQIQLGDANVTDVKTSGVITSSGIRVGTNSPTISAAVEINSNTQGFLPPRMTQTQRDAISTPATGLVIFNSTSNSLEYKSSTSWVSLSVSSPGSAVFLPTIVIGNQQWMKENLDVVTYRNGDVIPQVTDAAAWAGLTTGAWCYYSNSADNGTIYGKLYNWYAVNDSRGLAPQGWHIPTDAEWTTLGNLLGGDAVAGGKMKTTGTTRWNTPNTSATNESGFAGLPGGNRNSDGTYVNISGDGSWWSATPSSSTVARFRQANYNSVLLNSGNAIMVQGYSVRCLRD